MIKCVCFPVKTTLIANVNANAIIYRISLAHEIQFELIYLFRLVNEVVNDELCTRRGLEIVARRHGN